MKVNKENTPGVIAKILSRISGYDNNISNLQSSVNTLAKKCLYGTCGTAADIAEKAVASTGFTLIIGARIAVKFSYANTVGNPTLNVNGTGAKAIAMYGTTAISSALYWGDGDVVEFVYDGANWLLCNVSPSVVNSMNEKLANKANTGHTHDDRYYTETEMNTKLKSLIVQKSYTVTTDESNSGRWIADISLSGYSAISYSLVHWYSGTVMICAEEFSDTRVAGYCNLGGMLVTVVVVYLKK